MCGGYELDADPEAIVRAFRVDSVQIELPLDGWPSASIERFPRQRGLMVVARTDETGATLRMLGPARFGLVPSFAEDLNVGNKLFNARSESVHERPAFRTAFQRRRCLVPVSAFYEWKRAPEGTQRYRFRAAAGGILALAGIWESRKLPSGERLASFAILTTAANALIAPIHARMPVVLPDEAAQALWLSAQAPQAALQALFQPLSEAALEALPG